MDKVIGIVLMAGGVTGVISVLAVHASNRGRNMTLQPV